jgi:predicted anti-sigma-YlaC factor YlaD
MTRPISDREWQQLSAHLDGQLTAKETARLENQLQQNAELRAAYEELRRVRILLRSQPRLRAPRNFTLSPEMAGIAPVGRAAPVRSSIFGLVTALASLMLVLVIAGEFLLASSQMAAQPAAMQMQMEESVTEAPLMLQMEDEANSKELPLLSTPQVGMRAYPPPGSSESDVAAPEALETRPMEYPAPEQAVEGEQGEEALSMLPEDDIQSEPEIRPARTSELQWLSNGWRVAQVLLLAIILTSAAAALILRRKESR